MADGGGLQAGLGQHVAHAVPQHLAHAVDADFGVVARTALMAGQDRALGREDQEGGLGAAAIDAEEHQRLPGSG